MSDRLERWGRCSHMIDRDENLHPLRICVIANEMGNGSLSASLSGGDRIAIELVRRWVDLGLEVTLITGKSGRHVVNRYLTDPKPNLTIEETSQYVYEGFSRVRLVLFQFFATIAALRHIRYVDSKFDVILVTSQFLPDTIHGYLAKALSQPHITTIGTLWLHAPRPFSSESPYSGVGLLSNFAFYLNDLVSVPLIERYSDMIWVTNEVDRADIIAASGFRADCVIAVKGGVDLKLHSPSPSPIAPEFDAVFVGRFHPQKGVVGLVDIWHQVVSALPSARLAMIGDGPLKPDVEREIQRRGLGKSISLLGFLDGQAKVNVLRRSRIFVHPVTYDVGGIAAIEGMACGLPVVTFDLPALRSYIPRGVARVHCFDRMEFAARIRELLGNDRECARLRAEALDYARSTWDWDTKAELLLKLMRQAVSNRWQGGLFESRK
jgi:glycosyltransferase involved in cell wall biosynthesis